MIRVDYMSVIGVPLIWSTTTLHLSMKRKDLAHPILAAGERAVVKSSDRNLAEKAQLSWRWYPSVPRHQSLTSVRLDQSLCSAPYAAMHWSAGREPLVVGGFPFKYSNAHFGHYTFGVGGFFSSVARRIRRSTRPGVGALYERCGNRTSEPGQNGFIELSRGR